MNHIPQNARLIPLTQGKVAIVDRADFEWLSKHKWFAVLQDKRWYAARKVMTARGRRNLKMHTAIMCPPLGMEVDHINHNGLDNRRSQLRVCARLQNGRNRSKQKGKSKYKGVCARGERWIAQIWDRDRERKIHLGIFEIEEDAAKAYAEAARSLFGEFAYTNFSESAEPVTA